jgi:hypothetical protein
VAPIRHLCADAAAPLRSFLDKLRKAAAYIDSRRVRDDRKVMLWSLQRDLTAAGEALEILESQVAECAALYEHVRAEAARIAGRDGCAIAPDDPNSYRGRPRNLSTVEIPCSASDAAAVPPGRISRGSVR